MLQLNTCCLVSTQCQSQWQLQKNFFCQCLHKIHDQTGRLGTRQQTQALLITSANFRLLSSNTLSPQPSSLFEESCGDSSHSCWWNNILIRKQSLGRPGSLPFLLLSAGCSSPPERERSWSKAMELTCCSDSLHCLRIIILQLAACRLCGVFTKSDLAGAMNA